MKLKGFSIVKMNSGYDKLSHGGKREESKAKRKNFEL
ncbi:hypothetical protein SLEP1_g4977 [Rubroshorea leprosula]|uniref:Uncharacterized protein n=1 Tax=Rubroshorea leprosula TaxID=152421 RepID=A0AAV5HZC6_9ROSI|nr:hypothetical protein SLEP1_g4977 [Rubroshorea leprosula]